jgi:phosphatidylglycerol:prolipoprotein diacylglycerol transferase
MFPELFTIPFLNFTLNTYGLLLASSFIAGLYLMARLAARDGLNRNRVYDLGLWVLAASLIGSKLLLVITEWNYYRQNPSQIFTLDFFRSGGVFYGGFIAAVIVSIIVMKVYQLPWWKTADAFAPGIAIGTTLGRIGCFSAGCCWGKPTTSAIGVHFSERGHEITGVPTIVAHLSDQQMREVWSQQLGGMFAAIDLHPTQLYEAFATLAIFCLLFWLRKRRKFDGQIILSYAILYAVARFIIEFWRGDERGSFLGLSTSQFIAVVIFIGSVVLFLLRYRQSGHSDEGVPATRAAA